MEKEIMKANSIFSGGYEKINKDLVEKALEKMIPELTIYSSERLFNDGFVDVEKTLLEKTELKIEDENTIIYLILRSGSMFYNYASEELKKNIIISLVALYKSQQDKKINYNDFHEAIKKNLTFACQAVELDSTNYELLNEDLKKNPNILLILGDLVNGYKRFNDVDHDLLQSKEFISYALEYGYKNGIELVSQSILEDEDIAKKAIDIGILLKYLGKANEKKDVVIYSLIDHEENEKLYYKDIYNAKYVGKNLLAEDVEFSRFIKQILDELNSKENGLKEAFKNIILSRYEYLNDDELNMEISQYLDGIYADNNKEWNITSDAINSYLNAYKGTIIEEDKSVNSSVKFEYLEDNIMIIKYKIDDMNNEIIDDIIDIYEVEKLENKSERNRS